MPSRFSCEDDLRLLGLALDPALPRHRGAGSVCPVIVVLPRGCDAYRRRRAVAVEAFHARRAPPTCGPASRQPCRRVLDHAEPRHEVLGARAPRRSARCRRSAARDSVPPRSPPPPRACGARGTPRPRAAPARAGASGSRDLQLEVLGREPVRQLHRLLEARGEHERAVARQRRARDLAARQRARAGAPSSAATASRSARDGVSSTARAIGSCSAWASRSAATNSGVGGVVGHHQDLARARHHVDAHVAEHLRPWPAPRRCCRAPRSCPPAGWSRCRRPARRSPGPRPPGRPRSPPRCARRPAPPRSATGRRRAARPARSRGPRPRARAPPSSARWRDRRRARRARRPPRGRAAALPGRAASRCRPSCARSAARTRGGSARCGPPRSAATAASPRPPRARPPRTPPAAPRARRR